MGREQIFLSSKNISLFVPASTVPHRCQTPRCKWSHCRAVPTADIPFCTKKLGHLPQRQALSL